MRLVSVYEVTCTCGATVTTDEQQHSTEATCPQCGARISMLHWGRFTEVRTGEEK